ncbi:DUF2950 domain-containing protein [Mesorhizobium xinjiangense]|uniref:DUF2950 domain-containing protein n=1 Tax=Mesorhizobium xinjiangense TaxID=2678685 RepID=UPI0012EED423|nr:DUF2950 domain-containing protein [Mesorhizobium xinjiangense]
MNTKLHRLLVRRALAAGIAAGLATFAPASLAWSQEEETGISAFAAKDEPPAYDNAEAAVEAFMEALVADDVDRLAGVLGLDAARLKADDATMQSYADIRASAAEQVVVEEFDDRALIDLGAALWPFPFPVVKTEDGKWAFDTYAGLEEIVNRRVGGNELEAIATMRAYLEAQHDYASQDRDDDGVLEYAQKLISSEGATDGLYWPSESGSAASPAGEFVDQASLDTAAKGDGYFGYHFRILAGQGDRIAGGAYDYVINDNMIAGFGLVAWPARYGETGVQSFMVNQNGTIYEADLGAATDAIVKYVDRFNPDESWNVVGD